MVFQCSSTLKLGLIALCHHDAYALIRNNKYLLTENMISDFNEILNETAQKVQLIVTTKAYSYTPLKSLVFMF